MNGIMDRLGNGQSEHATLNGDACRRQIIEVTLDEQGVADQAIIALAGHGGVYQRGGRLVHVVRDAKPPSGVKRAAGAPRIVSLPLPRLRELLASAAIWKSWESARKPKVGQKAKGGLKRVRPPRWCAEAIDARGQWRGIPPIEAVVETPVLRPDGTIVQTPGYDQASGILFSPQGEYPLIDEHPSIDDAIAARDRILDLVSDFPFDRPEHKATWLAALLTPLARAAIDGPCPMFVVDANVRACGKGLLLDVAAMIATGRTMTRTSAPREEDEMRKRITSIAVAGEPCVMFDNVAGALGGAAMDAALTSTTWSDRILGRTEMTAALPMTCVWYATGNNVVLQADTARRVAHIRLESQEEKPEEREDFARPDLLGWLKQNRPSLVADALTILRGYFAAEEPDHGLKAWGSFEAWSRVIRNAVVWVGMADPGETRQELASQADQEAGLLRQLLAAWQIADEANEGMTVVQAINRAEHVSAMRDAIVEMTPPGKLPNPRSIGMRLNHLRGRICGGKRLVNRDGANHTKVWVVESVQGTRGTKGTKTPPLTREENQSAENGTSEVLVPQVPLVPQELMFDGDDGNPF